jgi:hypothetical protein
VNHLCFCTFVAFFILQAIMNAMSHTTRRSYRSALKLVMPAIVCSGWFSLVSEVAVAESASQVRYAAIQSQQVQLPEDFFVRVDSGRLEVALDTAGAIDSAGPRSNLLVHLINAAGVDRTATTNAQGIAEFDKVKADEHYAVVVAADAMHAAIPVIAVSAETAKSKGISNTSLRLPVTTPNKQEVLAALNRDIPPTAFDARGELLNVADYRSETLSSYRVRLQADGSMLGRVVVLDRDLAESLRYAKLHFLRNSLVVFEADSDPVDGGFSLQGVTPGEYDVIAAGPAGYAAFAFEVLAGEEVAPPPVVTPEERPVAFYQPPVGADRLCVCLIPPRMLGTTSRVIRDVYVDPTGSPVAGPMAGGYGGYGGYGGFGGGAGGGGGGMMGGGLGAGLAGLAAMAAVIASDEEGNNNNAVVSPIVIP